MDDGARGGGLAIDPDAPLRKRPLLSSLTPTSSTAASRSLARVTGVTRASPGPLPPRRVPCFVDVSTEGSELASLVGKFGFVAIGPLSAQPADYPGLSSTIAEHAANHSPIFVHMCFHRPSLSRARDRRRRSRVRTTGFPLGVHPRSQRVLADNAAVVKLLELIRLVVVESLGIFVITAFLDSYLWEVMEFLDVPGLNEWSEAEWLPCAFGASHSSSKLSRAWGGLDLSRLACSSCPSWRSGEHQRTSGAHRLATYIPRGWQASFANLVGIHLRRASGHGRVRLVDSGRVRRHRDRGADEPSVKEQRDVEDLASRAGVRNPAHLLESWPEYVEAMRPVRAALLSAWASIPELRGLDAACGAAPRRPPPSLESVRAARSFVCDALGLTFDAGDSHHAASSWRFNLVKCIQKAAGDPDTHIASWLRDGCPSGLALPIPPGNLLPLRDKTAEISLDELAAQDRITDNHPSFKELHGEDQAPGLALVEEQLDEGFGRLFASQADAEIYLGAKAFPAQLGNIAKERPEGGFKHRLIMDLKRNHVNRAVRLSERQVLPRFTDHASDIACLSELGEISVMIIDFKHAFMTLPLAEAEQRYHCSFIPEGVRRRRPPLDESEPDRGTFVVWRVLGFGGKPSPLLYSRVSSFASRSGQALLLDPDVSAARAALQLYVDDPAVTLAGSYEARARAADLLLLWWLVLGIPMSWAKGQFSSAKRGHTWIGVVFKLLRPGVARMTLPAKFISELLSDIAPFCRGCGVVSLKLAEKVVGRLGRVAHVVPAARPFAGMMYAALSASKRAAGGRRREAPPMHLAARRFNAGARWMRALLEGGATSPLPLHTDIFSQGHPLADVKTWRVEFDASPWGAGGILFLNDTPAKFFVHTWLAEEFEPEVVKIGDCAFQTLFEFVTLFLCLVLWASDGDATLAILGDNVSALQAALTLRCRGSMLRVAREIAWRKARFRWSFSVGHLPKESNRLADALSRQAAGCPEAVLFPGQALSGAVQVVAPKVRDLWYIR